MIAEKNHQNVCDNADKINYRIHLKKRKIFLSENIAYQVQAEKN